jgi:hypothetical protein
MFLNTMILQIGPVNNLSIIPKHGSNNPIYLAGCRALGLLINYLQVLFGESLCLKTSLEKVKTKTTSQ